MPAINAMAPAKLLRLIGTPACGTALQNVAAAALLCERALAASAFPTVSLGEAA